MEQSKKEFAAFIDEQRLLELHDEKQLQEIVRVGQALSSPTRLQILLLLNRKPYLMSEISAELHIQPSSAAFHLKMLEETGLVNVEYSTKHKGTLKYYSYGTRDLLLRLRPREGLKDIFEPFTASISIGDYVDAKFSKVFGFASDRKLLALNDNKLTFAAERHKIQILWNRYHGYVTYALPNAFTEKAPIKSISFSMEICSETNGYNHDYPSDITFWVNDVELCTWTCPGDFGDKYGTFTPSWWYPESTKYGLLTNITVKDNGVYLNNKLINKNTTLEQLNLSAGDRLHFRIGVKENAEHCGGFNLFGEKFGNFNQNIQFTATYK